MNNAKCATPDCINIRQERSEYCEKCAGIVSDQKYKAKKSKWVEIHDPKCADPYTIRLTDFEKERFYYVRTCKCYLDGELITMEDLIAALPTVQKQTMGKLGMLLHKKVSA